MLEADFKILVVRHTYSLLHIRDCMDSMDTWDPQKFSGVLIWSWNHQGIWETSRALQILRWTWELGSPRGLEETLGGCGNPHGDSYWPNRTFRCHWGHSGFIGTSGCLYSHSKNVTMGMVCIISKFESLNLCVVRLI